MTVVGSSPVLSIHGLLARILDAPQQLNGCDMVAHTLFASTSSFGALLGGGNSGVEFLADAAGDF